MGLRGGEELKDHYMLHLLQNSTFHNPELN